MLKSGLAACQVLFSAIGCASGSQLDGVLGSQLGSVLHGLGERPGVVLVPLSAVCPCGWNAALFLVALH